MVKLIAFAAGTVLALNMFFATDNVQYETTPVVEEPAVQLNAPEPAVHVSQPQQTVSQPITEVEPEPQPPAEQEPEPTPPPAPIESISSVKELVFVNGKKEIWCIYSFPDGSTERKLRATVIETGNYNLDVSCDSITR